MVEELDFEPNQQEQEPGDDTDTRLLPRVTRNVPAAIARSQINLLFRITRLNRPSFRELEAGHFVPAQHEDFDGAVEVVTARTAQH